MPDREEEEERARASESWSRALEPGQRAAVEGFFAERFGPEAGAAHTQAFYAALEAAEQERLQRDTAEAQRGLARRGPLPPRHYGPLEAHHREIAEQDHAGATQPVTAEPQERQADAGAQPSSTAVLVAVGAHNPVTHQFLRDQQPAHADALHPYRPEEQPQDERLAQFEREQRMLAEKEARIERARQNNTPHEQAHAAMKAENAAAVAGVAIERPAHDPKTTPINFSGRIEPVNDNAGQGRGAFPVDDRSTFAHVTDSRLDDTVERQQAAQGNDNAGQALARGGAVIVSDRAHAAAVEQDRAADAAMRSRSERAAAMAEGSGGSEAESLSERTGQRAAELAAEAPRGESQGSRHADRAAELAEAGVEMTDRRQERAQYRSMVAEALAREGSEVRSGESEKAASKARNSTERGGRE